MTAPPAIGDAAWDEYRKHLYEALHAASRDYDQAILAVAGATLGLSVTFVHDMTPQPVAGTTDLLLLAWLLLLGSLVAIILSFVSSQAEIRRLIIAGRNAQPSSRAGVTTALNTIAGLALVGGLTLLATYAVANLRPA
jgi:hypothetical protein